MRITSVELCRLELQLVQPLETSAGAHARRPLVLVRIATDGATGVGECSALEEPTYTSEYADGAEAVLLEQLLPRLLDGPGLDDVPAAMVRLGAVRGHQMAKAAIEMALLDAELTAVGRSLASYLGATRARIPAGATVSLGSPDSVVAAIADAVRLGYQRVKVKIAPGADTEVLRAARDAFPELVLAADANGSYDMEEPGQHSALLLLDGIGLAYLEQPLAPGELAASARLAHQLETPVVLDESVSTRAELELAATLGALDGLSVKPARVGGLLAGRELLGRCSELGLSACLGGMLESGIGRAAAIALGALPGFDLPGDLGASERYFEPDLTEPHMLVASGLVVPSGPGLGIRLDEAAIARSLVRSHRLR